VSRTDAERVCEDFKDRVCDSSDDVIVQWPEKAVLLGRAIEIVYRSDKWMDKDEKADRSHQDYYHPFDTEVDVLVAADSPLASEPGTNGLRSRRLTKPPKHVAQLADALEVIYESACGLGQRTIECEAGPSLGDSPPLLAFRRNGEDTLVVPLHDGAVVLRGGQLDVRPEGITG